MKSLYHQTKQAFFFSLAFYLVAVVLMLFKVGFAPIVFSVALLISLIWIFMVFREVMLSKAIENTERLILLLFIIFTNIIGGAVYFFLLRERVIGKKS